MFSKINLSF